MICTLDVLSEATIFFRQIILSIGIALQTFFTKHSMAFTTIGLKLWHFGCNKVIGEKQVHEVGATHIQPLKSIK